MEYKNMQYSAKPFTLQRERDAFSLVACPHVMLYFFSYQIGTLARSAWLQVSKGRER